MGTESVRSRPALRLVSELPEDADISGAKKFNVFAQLVDKRNMERATDVEIDLFEAFLAEEDPGMAKLMGELLGIQDTVIDLTAGTEESLPQVIEDSHSPA